jgi:hypothetical protein
VSKKNGCVWGMGVGNNNPPHATAGKKDNHLNQNNNIIYSKTDEPNGI